MKVPSSSPGARLPRRDDPGTELCQLVAKACQAGAEFVRELREAGRHPCISRARVRVAAAARQVPEQVALLARRACDRLPDRNQEVGAQLRRLPPAELRRAAPAALTLLGAGLLLYVGSQYVIMYLQQQRLERQWSEENHSAARKRAVLSGKNALTRVEIPKISLDAIVVEGTGRRDLLLGPGHMEQTPEPGEVGNSVITGHRDTFFRHIYELDKGDDIEVQRNGNLYTYEVTGKKIVEPDDLSVLEQSEDRRLTLITCYPIYYIGPAPNRLVVFARLVEKPPGEASAGDAAK